LHSTILIFIDGVGIGKADSVNNPFFRKEFKTFTQIFGATPHLELQNLNKGDIYLFPTDACLGVDGLPQSGTGQTSIFCGVNAPLINGSHFGPFPPSAVVPIIKEQNIFAELKRAGKKVSFANAYPKIFFDYVNSGKQRLSVTSLSCLLSDVKLKKAAELRAGTALSAEIDNFRWVNKLNYKLPVIAPELAGKRLINIASKHHFTLFEFFLTDHLGHARIPELFDHIYETLDNFLFYMLTNLPEDFTLIVCSDHGNFEDMSTKMHTRNPALTIAAGKNSSYLAKEISDISLIKKAIMEFYI
jgi:2,3-bisphosphoglycerate-independent phosphoglycerate mutase